MVSCCEPPWDSELKTENLLGEDFEIDNGTGVRRRVNGGGRTAASESEHGWDWGLLMYMSLDVSSTSGLDPRDCHGLEDGGPLPRLF